MAPSISLPSLLVVTPTIRLGLRGGTGRLIDFNFVLAALAGLVLAGLADAEKIRLFGMTPSWFFDSLVLLTTMVVG